MTTMKTRPRRPTSPRTLPAGLALPARLVYEMMVRSASAWRTRAEEAIDEQADRERDQLWAEYTRRLDLIGTQVARAKAPIRRRYQDQISHATGRYREALNSMLAELQAP